MSAALFEARMVSRRPAAVRHPPQVLPRDVSRVWDRPGTMMCRTVLVTATACALALGAPASAFAHAILVGSVPAAGAKLSASPARVSATFSEPLDRMLSALT